MVVIGITGGIGTGKSTVSSMLRGLGAQLIDADVITHKLMLPGEPAFEPLVDAFGTGILAPDGTIDRRELGRRAFADAGGTRLIESIIHPLVIEAIRERISWMSQVSEAPEQPAVAVIDVPLLYESGLDAVCDQVWVVTAASDVQRQRVAARDGAAAGEVLARERWQMPMEEKLARADAVIDNSGGLEETAAQVARLWPLNKE
jgi:dephospho-CoA kinase